MTNTSANVGEEFRKFDGTGLDLWKIRTENTLYLQVCAEVLEEIKSAGMDDATWKLLNCKEVAHIYMAVSDEVLGNIKGLTSGHEVWSKLKTMYESTTTVNQVHLTRRLMVAGLEDAKFAAEHISTFNLLLNQLQYVGLQIFNNKMKAIFLLTILPETWEALIVSLSNSGSPTFDGVRRAIPNAEISEKASVESSSPHNITRGRAATKKTSIQKSRNKSKGK